MDAIGGAVQREHAGIAEQAAARSPLSPRGAEERADLVGEAGVEALFAERLRERLLERHATVRKTETM